MKEATPAFILNLSDRLSAGDVGNPKHVMDAMAVSMAELVDALKQQPVFRSVTEAVTYDPEKQMVTGMLYIVPGTWSIQHQALSFYILRQGFTYSVEKKCYEYKLEL